MDALYTWMYKFLLRPVVIRADLMAAGDHVGLKDLT